MQSPGPAARPHDWNDERRPAAPRRPEVNDETLREAAQSPSVRQPTLAQRAGLLRHMAAAGVEAASLGMPCSSSRAAADAVALARTVAAERLPLALHAAARCLPSDVLAVTGAAQDAGTPIGVSCFMPSSAPRLAAEGWTPAEARRRIRAAVELARWEGCAAMFVAEDASRAAPHLLEELIGEALDAGATRICIADTVGCATPAGAERLVSWTRRLVGRRGRELPVDWHGHRDRGLAVACALAAVAAGADRVHGTILGLGERAGNAELELLLANLALLGIRAPDGLRALPAYARAAADAYGVVVAGRDPVVGADAFRTAAGVHAAAIRKARSTGDIDLAELVYAALPAAWLGQRQQVALSPVSGSAAVRWWVEEHGGDPANDALVHRLLTVAKGAERALTDQEALGVLRE